MTNFTQQVVKFNELLQRAEPFYILTVIWFGLIGNSVSLGVYFTKRNKVFKHTNQVLIWLAIVDNCFLISLSVIVLKHFGINLFDKFEVSCRLTVYLNYVFSFLSSWLVALFSIERFMLVFYPFKQIRPDSYKHRTNTTTLTALVVFAFLFHIPFLITSGLEELDGTRYCVTLTRWFNYVKVSILIDSLLTIILPFVVIATMNLLISSKLMQLYRNFKHKQSESRVSLCKSRMLLADPEPSSSRTSSLSHTLKLIVSQKKIRLRSYIRSTRMLFAMSVVFLVFNFPIAFTKIRYSLQSFKTIVTGDNSTTDQQLSYLTVDPLDESIERVSCYIYYLNFASNFLFYLLAYKNKA